MKISFYYLSVTLPGFALVTALAALSTLSACGQLPGSPAAAPERSAAAAPAPVPAPLPPRPRAAGQTAAASAASAPASAAAHAPATALPNANAATPAATGKPAALPGALLHIDPASSLITIIVRRGGMLARLGHDHVVASHTISGTVDPARNHADLQFRLDQLTVDEADLRRTAGLDTQPSADAIEGTRHNMLDKVLDAGRYPLVAIHVQRGQPGQPLQVAITLHGVTRNIAVPVDMREQDGRVAVTGTFTVKQSDFGIVPFSVMAGAVAVQDQIELHFSLTAR